MRRVRTQPFVIVRAFIEKDGKFLLVQENWGHVKGLWNFPAGWLDLSEDPLAGAVREVKEETGYDFTPEHLLGIYSFIKYSQSEKGQPVEFVYTGRVSGEQSKIDHHEIKQTRWFTPEEIMAMNESELRDKISKRMLEDYLAGQRYPLEVVSHSKTNA